MNAMLLSTGRDGAYSVTTAHSLAMGLGCQEALTVVVKFVLHAGKAERPLRQHPTLEGDLLIELIEANSVSIQRHDGAFISRLCRDEAIAFVTTYLLTGEQLFSGFQSYEANIAQWNRWNKVGEPVIEGFLVH